ncbi:hypothetical protein AVEN_36024-1 [Araneus ventricosus]|uniref:Uncharacterized protein n=1 Tax=Araneus ventricosus TaxID=182803 RepID=A0A4Y2GZG1_ARAVE|nr:hypothetical protein AVEN_36024-1 [Araneus ventricosus]
MQIGLVSPEIDPSPAIGQSAGSFCHFLPNKIQMWASFPKNNSWKHSVTTYWIGAKPDLFRRPSSGVAATLLAQDALQYSNDIFTMLCCIQNIIATLWKYHKVSCVNREI